MCSFPPSPSHHFVKCKTDDRTRLKSICFSCRSWAVKPSIISSLHLSGLSAWGYFFAPSFAAFLTQNLMCTTRTQTETYSPAAQALSRPGKQICPFSYLIGWQCGEEGGQVWCIKWPCDSITHTTALWWGGVSITQLPCVASIKTHTHAADTLAYTPIMMTEKGQQSKWSALDLTGSKSVYIHFNIFSFSLFLFLIS